MATNDITVSILEDGTVRIDTNAIAGPAHLAAEKALAWMAREIGGTVTRTKRAHTHHHDHGKEHDHQHA